MPFIFQIVLLLALPLAFAYLFTLAGLAFGPLRAALKKWSRERRGQRDAPSSRR